MDPKRIFLRFFINLFPEFFQKAARESPLPEESLPPERASCQRKPAARESLLPESQKVPGRAEKYQGSDESAKKCQKVAERARESQDGPPRIFLRFFINFFLRFFKKTARESQREPQDCCQKSQGVPQNAKKCRRVPEKRNRVPERASGQR